MPAKKIMFWVPLYANPKWRRHRYEATCSNCYKRGKSFWDKCPECGAVAVLEDEYENMDK